jgi:hypothetical protein
MFVRYGLGDALEDQIIQYQRALHDLAVAMDAARKSGQNAAADQLRVQFDALTTEVNRLVGKKFTQESPSPFALNVANLGGTISKALAGAGGVALLGLGLIALMTLKGAAAYRPRAVQARRANRRRR